ncbi:MAG TPA: glycerol-3-phosphate dehydrogenase C-terminal domain-containing protein, partial [Bacillales bacterium]|nr:glycerol-3-phosphate dehydrogenase C-terminal domain-containing protein [Bacillales bacterium]
MAEKVVDLAAEELPGTYPKSRTETKRLSGGSVGGSSGFAHFVGGKIREGTSLGLTADEAELLAKRYGSNVDCLYGILRRMGEEAEHHGLSKCVFAMIVYAIESEMAATPADFFIRRTGALYFNIHWLQQWKEPVIAYMAERLNWREEEIEKHKQTLEQRIEEATFPLKE